MNAARNAFVQNDFTNALAIYKKAEAIAPNDLDVRLNLASCNLASGRTDEALREADEALKIDNNSAAAWFIKGSTYLRLANHEEAVKALENSRKIDPGEIPTYFQLGVARMGLKQWEAAIAAFREGLGMDPNRLHSAAHYLLGQSLLRAGKEEEGKKEIQMHQANVEAGSAGGSGAFERSKFTQPRVPFKLDQPDTEGNKVHLVEATKDVLGEAAQTCSSPIAVIHANQSGAYNLLVSENGGGVRVLQGISGKFKALGALIPGSAGAVYSKMLAADLQNDRFDDVVALGDKGTQLIKFGANNSAADASQLSLLNRVQAADGLLIDLDFTGKLDLVIVTPTNDLRIYRQMGPLTFADVTSTSGIPANLRNVLSVAMADWNRDGVTDLICSRKDGGPLLLEKERGGRLIPKEVTNWVAGAALAVGDFDNDLRTDLAIVTKSEISICFNSGGRKVIAIGNASDIRRLKAIDYDSDGWMDLFAIGDKVRAWRNVGAAGFWEKTTELGLDQITGRVAEVHFADFDQDCDGDLIVAMEGGGLRYFRNDGGNANSEIKVQFVGNRSNASGIGCKVEIAAGGLRLIRTIDQLPAEIGVGKARKLDSFLVHWFNWPQGSAEIEVDCKQPILALELTIQEGSCPYLYAWDGERFRFVTDILGAAPIGLPLAEGRYIDAQPEEFVWIGNEQNFRPRDGKYQLQITEELREVLYLDEAKLVVVDHEPGVEVHSTDKLRPGKPFPKGAIITLRNEHPLQRAETLEGRDVTATLQKVDQQRVSPANLRGPQLRGLAEPHGMVLDFGPLDTTRPLALVMNGWLRFGGGMANIAASHDASLPFPFPTLEAEVDGQWQPVNAIVGAPAGKTKTIVVDLTGKLPVGARRLRINQAFEIHWDRIALMEKANEARTTFVNPSSANLHSRGFSQIKNLPSDFPLTPDYEKVTANSMWTIIPGGWCTRYGDVSELIAVRDEALALLNSGDELTLQFDVSSLPPKAPRTTREFFIYVDGWDKDSDFHVTAGQTVGPLPFHGMDDQAYGRETRPSFASDALHSRYNTRWVDSRALKQTAQR
ncbi:MAG TPA: FG-GAP-like repeat-containing protein [Verrucomicrobiae bacterium]|nr:FG-GAP-like repeat-containing protein [Verrucomicrobiae bacterium]